MTSSTKINFTHILIVLFCTFLMSNVVNALDVEPGLWAHIPVERHFVGIGYVKTEADILVDPNLKLEDVELDMDTWAAKYIYSFESFGKSSRIDITQGYQEGHWKGLLDGVYAETSRKGASDTFIRYAISLYGAPPLKAGDYVAYRRKQDGETIVGAGLAVRLPTGEYDDERLINLGQNRFAIRPQVGIEHNRGPWTFEATSEVAFYSDNNDFYNGSRLEQDPLLKIGASAEYTFYPGFRATVAYAYDYGGETSVNNVKSDNRKQNEAWAMSITCPLNATTGVKFSWVQTDTQESTGLDSESFAVAIVASF
jgi:hypothetical protein